MNGWQPEHDHSICERCWVEHTSIIEKLGDEVFAMTAVDPTLTPNPTGSHKTCCRCGWPTWAGIYFETGDPPEELPFCPNKPTVTYRQ